MFRQWSMAGLAGDDHVPALLLLLDNVGVTGLAGIVASKRNGPRRRFRDGGSAIVPILAKAGRDDCGAQDDECKEGDHDDNRKPGEVFSILKQVRYPCAGLRARSARMRCAMFFDTCYFFRER